MICSNCSGDGWYAEDAHEPLCDGNCDNCPIQIQVQCAACDGLGKVQEPQNG